MSDVKATEKVQLTVSQIKRDLSNGLDRDKIGEKYGLNKANVKRLFQDPALKGLKVKAAPNFVLTNDTDGAEASASTVAEKSAPTKKEATAQAAEAGTW